VSASIRMKRCSSNYARASKLQKAATNCVSGWRLSIRSRISVDGKDDVPVIGDCAKISSICDGAPSSTISTSWFVPNSSKLIFRTPLDYLTGALGGRRVSPPV
jgi:hypothetical protein